MKAKSYVMKNLEQNMEMHGLNFIEEPMANLKKTSTTERLMQHA
eukprot:CAMPEP_0170473948 /NCGR_PEP_ID=MMETSP0123-20130129/15780_1 /TAXON_ID=182087 /ORGANISM="Favella ehrenbergii, Strain Fehren 1" /LENGTH=43 /DNA_ID= /DNA_START= /DNA_END= /DNA_ORIENTATION=